jgi:hypothetical protein
MPNEILKTLRSTSNGVLSLVVLESCFDAALDVVFETQYVSSCSLSLSLLVLFEIYLSCSPFYHVALLCHRFSSRMHRSTTRHDWRSSRSPSTTTLQQLVSTESIQRITYAQLPWALQYRPHTSTANRKFLRRSHPIISFWHHF